MRKILNELLRGASLIFAKSYSGPIQVLQSGQGSKVCSLTGPTGPVLCVACSKSYVAVGGEDFTCCLYDSINQLKSYKQWVQLSMNQFIYFLIVIKDNSNAVVAVIFVSTYCWKCLSSHFCPKGHRCSASSWPDKIFRTLVTIPYHVRANKTASLSIRKNCLN